MSVLRSVKMLSRQTLIILYKITVRSVLDYTLPVYFKTLKQTKIVRLEQIQYRAAKLVTGALHYSSRDKLNIEIGWETIQKRSDILGLSIFQKIHLHETRPLIRKCMPKLDFERQHFLRSKGGYIPFKNLGSKFKTSFFPYHSELWNTLPTNIQTLDMIDFKSYTSKEIKTKKQKSKSKGSKLGNSLLNR